MKAHIEFIIAIIGGIAGVVAVLSYFGKFLFNLLNKKKEEIELKATVDRNSDRITSLEKTREENQSKLEKISILEERIKHL